MSGRDWDSLDEGERERVLERLRRVGLWLDRNGQWWHEGAMVAHEGLSAALSRWLDVLDDGRYIVRFDGDRYAYVEVEDAPYVVRTIEIDRRDGVRVYLKLSDGRTEELNYGSLRIGADNVMYCRVRGRFPARFSRQAYYLLSALVEQEQEQFVLRAKGQSWSIRSEAG
jgi:hypothetical protein